MSSLIARLAPEDWGRLVAYSMGVTWALVFAIWTPSTYVGVISLTAVHFWSALMGVGCLVSAIGVLTGRDTKMELGGIYLTLAGTVLYFFAQTGFTGQKFSDRVPLLVYILWHDALMLPRLLGLEAYRRRVRAIVKAEG